MTLSIVVEPHAVLDAAAFVTRLAHPLAQIDRAADVLGAARSSPPLHTSDAVKVAVRDLLRAGGFKPAGRSKPASEYLVGAEAEGRFPSINPVVDACNIVSLFSGLPISLVDIDLATPPFAIRVAPAGTTYAFNPSGQVIDASGLVCLWDALGPTGTPVKDSQRTKTHDGTQLALAIVWGTTALPGRTAETVRWYRALTAAMPGATVEDAYLDLRTASAR